MHCTRVTIPGGVGYVCTRGVKRKRCADCGNRDAVYLCDWKVKRRNGKPGTCDRGLCAACASSPAPEKHLCRAHTGRWMVDPRNPQRIGAEGSGR